MIEKNTSCYPRAMGNQIRFLKCGLGIGYSKYRPKVSANLGLGFGIKPNQNSGFGRALSTTINTQNWFLYSKTFSY